MDQFIEFATNNILLFAALLIVLTLLLQNIIATSGNKSSLRPLQVTEMINREEAVILDVRPLNDFNSGHIINAINIPHNALKNQLTQMAKYKGRPIIVACRSGAQSSGASKQLRDAGHEKVYNLQGGMLAWQNDNLPIKRK